MVSEGPKGPLVFQSMLWVNSLQNLATGRSLLSLVFSRGLGGLAKGRRISLMAGRLSRTPLEGSRTRSFPPRNSLMASVQVLAGPYISCPSRYGVISFSCFYFQLKVKRFIIFFIIYFSLSNLFSLHNSHENEALELRIQLIYLFIYIAVVFTVV